MAAIDIDTALERLAWHVEIDGASQTIDLLPSAFGRTVSVMLDGVAIGRLRKPRPQEPWTETEIRLERSVIAVGLTWHGPVMRTDVFLSGTSLRDGRTVAEVRAQAPAPLSAFEVWAVGGIDFLDPPPHRAFVVLVVGCVASWVIILVLSPIPPPLRSHARAVLLVTSIGLMLGIGLVEKSVAGRLFRKLLRYPELGNLRIVLWFLGVIGALAAVFLAPLALIAAMSVLRRTPLG